MVVRLGEPAQRLHRCGAPAALSSVKAVAVRRRMPVRSRIQTRRENGRRKWQALVCRQDLEFPDPRKAAPDRISNSTRELVAASEGIDLRVHGPVNRAAGARCGHIRLRLLLALLRPAARLRECLLIRVDRKSSTHPQNDAPDPKRTPRTRLSCAAPTSHLGYLIQN